MSKTNDNIVTTYSYARTHAQTHTQIIFVITDGINNTHDWTNILISLSILGKLREPILGCQSKACKKKSSVRTGSIFGHVQVPVHTFFLFYLFLLAGYYGILNQPLCEKVTCIHKQL